MSHEPGAARTFDLLSPDDVLQAVERAHGLSLDGTLSTFASYVNRVYGLRSDEGARYVAKFYRPGRWTREAILEEHALVLECAGLEVPVVAPLRGLAGETLAVTRIAREGVEETFHFSLSPLRAGRGFDAEEEDDWRRLGALVGRVHAVAAGAPAPSRLVATPRASTAVFARELLDAGVVHPDCRGELEAIITEALDRIAPLFDGVAIHRIHGDCHRGNILDRKGEGLLLIDFDDMMVGPAVQDLWLLLPDHAAACRRELELVLEGYESFRPFEIGSLRLIEPLRLMRMVYYLAWQSRQRDDARFRAENPAWGSRAFWLLELEDLRNQLQLIREEMDGPRQDGESA